ncbi:MAG: insulinase family protein [Lachnospiraceae bacterium]|nr:insulinase family protein [Lachnospiraceae bacterium]
MTSYELKHKSRIEEIGADALILEHKKTGAKVFLMPCEDDNKVFAVGFRTPAGDSTGVPHILEHSVLCGSDKYPCKDPFIELAKGSLNTFLNAMTYPDKTVYPIASCNDKDFENLTDVYLDAVFFPKMRSEEKIFRQEGWHYELDDPEGELSYNGVVYNEMKGVYSSADGLLERAISRVLYEGCTYGEESGGDPDNIPELTYDAFKAFHAKYYHPSNSYIYLYGNCDMDRMLDRIDKEYLSRFDRITVDSQIPLPEKWNAPKDVSFDYPIMDSESEEKSAILSWHAAVDCELDPVESTAMQILDYVLLDVPGAPLQKALISAGIGDDICGGFAGGIRLPYFSVIAKNADLARKGEFLDIVKNVLKSQADGELDKLSVEAAINVLEFRAREADFGSMPKGLAYGLQSFDSWLYDADPTMHLRFDEIFKTLRSRINEGYFEETIRKYLIDNPYQASITMKPVKGLQQKNEEKLKNKLAEIKAGFSEDEVTAVIEKTNALKEYQSEPSKKEDILKIPMLKREDIRKDVTPEKWEERSHDGYRLLFCDVFTSGIAYIKLVYDLKKIPAEDIPYAAFLAEVMGYIDTEKHSYADLSTQINLNSGGLGFCVESYADLAEDNKSVMTFAANCKVLYDKTDFAFGMMDEILFESRLDDVDRLKEIIAEIRSKTKESLVSSGHLTALNRAGSAYSTDRWFKENTKGIAYLRMLENTDAEKMSAKLKEICQRIFSKDNLLIHIVCDVEGFEAVKSSLAIRSSEGGKPELLKVELRQNGREAFTTAGMVNFISRFGNYKNHGHMFSGSMLVLRTLLNYDYLWNNIRVKGGAYGCGALFGNSGIAGFYTYRDPNLSVSDQVLKGIPDFVRNYDADEREMTKAVIGTISDQDTPMTPLGKGLRALSCYLGHLTTEMRQKTRNEILGATPEDIRRLAPVIEDVISDESVCAIACESKAREESEYFDSSEPLFS